MQGRGWCVCAHDHLKLIFTFFKLLLVPNLLIYCFFLFFLFFGFGGISSNAMESLLVQACAQELNQQGSRDHMEC